MSAWRGTALIVEKSHLYQRGRVLRHPLSREIVTTTNSQKEAEAYCRQNGYSHMKPVSNSNYFS